MAIAGSRYRVRGKAREKGIRRKKRQRNFNYYKVRRMLASRGGEMQKGNEKM